MSVGTVIWSESFERHAHERHEDNRNDNAGKERNTVAGHGGHRHVTTRHRKHAVRQVHEAHQAEGHRKADGQQVPAKPAQLVVLKRLSDAKRDGDTCTPSGRQSTMMIHSGLM